VLKYSSAAHPDPLHLHRADASVRTLGIGKDTPKGPALGLFEDSPFPSCQSPIANGDLILLFTDGLTEVEGPDAEPLSRSQLEEAVRKRSNLPANELIAGLITEIQDYSDRHEFDDDVCLVGMEIKRLGAS
jgi:serine phosphatase RsbU (regulator of sigma subunit)